MANRRLPQKITPTALVAFFEEDAAAIIGNALVPFSERPGFLEADLYERNKYKLDKNGEPLPLDLNAMNNPDDSSDFCDTLDEGYALANDEDMGLSFDDLSLFDDLEVFANYTH